ncbi:response regulator transcription factor [Yoonia sp. R2-816]|uniref:response regulator transcription factor n=1 Tax=Yoonia sp. R2-816 TaxID=3342638 RepID=UPI003727CBB7
MRILVADDHDLVRETIASFLTGSDGITAVDTAATLDDALKIVAGEYVFDLVLLDYDMPGMKGLTGLKRMKDAVGTVPVAILSGTASPSIAQAAIEAGAMGFVPKTLGSKSMVSAVKFMAMGEVYAPFEFMQQAQEKTVGNLTERETAVLQGVCEGKSNKEIARDLDLQEVTIKLHVKTLSRKLEARNRTHAAMIAKERNLV